MGCPGTFIVEVSRLKASDTKIFCEIHFIIRRYQLHSHLKLVRGEIYALRLVKVLVALMLYQCETILC